MNGAFSDERFNECWRVEIKAPNAKQNGSLYYNKTMQQLVCVCTNAAASSKW